jgi:formate transporter
VGSLCGSGLQVPIFIFFTLGYEHAIVNMFVILAAILRGAPVSFSELWL